MSAGRGEGDIFLNGKHYFCAGALTLALLAGLSACGKTAQKPPVIESGATSQTTARPARGTTIAQTGLLAGARLNAMKEFPLGSTEAEIVATLERLQLQAIVMTDADGGFQYACAGIRCLFGPEKTLTGIVLESDAFLSDTKLTVGSSLEEVRDIYPSMVMTDTHTGQVAMAIGFLIFRVEALDDTVTAWAWTLQPAQTQAAIADVTAATPEESDVPSQSAPAATVWQSDATTRITTNPPPGTAPSSTPGKTTTKSLYVSPYFPVAGREQAFKTAAGEAATLRVALLEQDETHVVYALQLEPYGALGVFYMDSERIIRLRGAGQSPESGTVVCQPTARPDPLAANVRGAHSSLQVNGPTVTFTAYDSAASGVPFETFVWAKGKGLVFYQQGYGATPAFTAQKS